MKHPVWILNSFLLVLTILLLGFMFFLRQNPPSPEDIEASGSVMALKGEITQINISKIYENDLFETYRKELPIYQPDAIAPLPQPPMPRPISVPALPTPQFLDPLNISLKGIIVILNDDTKNRAIISDNKTSIESTYHIGQMIEDAQLIRIMSNKVILLRSNGQQEVLYLREKDAQLDPTYATINNWSDVVQRVTDSDFNVNPKEFVSKVNNLAQFIDMLDLVTVYKDGKSVGCRIGKMVQKSLGAELGLQAGDIILNINGTPATNTPERFKIFKEIISMQEYDTIKAYLLRNNQEMAINYTLKDFKQKMKQNTGPSGETQIYMQTPSDQLREEQLRSLQERYKFAPTVQEIRAQERANMMRKGRPASAVKNINDKTVE